MRVEIRGWQGDVFVVVGVVTLEGGRAVPDEGARSFLDGMDIVKPGEPGTRLLPTDGEEYLQALQHNLRGTYLWATVPLE